MKFSRLVQSTDYGKCVNGCTVQYKDNNGSHTRKAIMKKRGHAVVCEKCGYSVNRGQMILAQKEN